MKKFLLKPVAYYTTEDNYENGEVGQTMIKDCSFIAKDIFDTAQEVINYVKSHFGVSDDNTIEWYEPDYFDEPGTYFALDMIENADGELASESELEDWKAGKINLYTSSFEFKISCVTLRELPQNVFESLSL